MDELLVADSFRVRLNPQTHAAEVRGFDLHLGRFAHSARAVADEHGVALDTLESFLEAARAQIAVAGPGFPRLELRVAHPDSSRDPELHLTPRPLPELTDTIELRTATALALPNPERKGPHITRYAALNRELGAEALLCDAEGLAVEGATTSLMWWEGHTLCVSAATGRVDSVTERLLLAAATEFDVPVARSRQAPAALAEREVWAVNALHGLRTVRRIDGAPLPAPEPQRLGRFRAALDRTWQAVLGAGFMPR